MSQRMDEKSVAQLLNRPVPFEFHEAREIATRTSRVSVFQIRLGESLCADLYLSAKHYTIVWKSTGGFQPTQPFMFADLQIKNVSSSKLKLFETIVPIKPHPLSPYYFQRCKATVVIDDGESRDYELTNNMDRESYISEFAKCPEALAKLILARYDSTIVIAGSKSSFATSFTAERKPNTVFWEFAIKIPRNVLLAERVLIWIARGPININKTTHRIDFKRSLSALHRLVRN